MIVIKKGRGIEEVKCQSCHSILGVSKEDRIYDCYTDYSTDRPESHITSHVICPVCEARINL